MYTFTVCQTILMYNFSNKMYITNSCRGGPLFSTGHLIARTMQLYTGQDFFKLCNWRVWGLCLE